jgi:NAD(P)-dependent dehydrogenase (short-subunit alcohol dehydrogenase family)
LANHSKSDLEQWCFDLSESENVCLKLTEWLTLKGEKIFQSATLINNAGMMPHIVPLSKADRHNLSKALRVSLEAPMLLASAFLSASDKWKIKRKVLNVSSGLAHRAMASQAGYCASKAGMDHFTRCLAIEESYKSNGAAVCSLSPGVIDTDMQAQLRSASGEDFPDLSYFVDHQQKGTLISSDQTADRILDHLSNPKFGEKPVADVRDA